MPKVSVIIPTKDAGPEFRATLEALKSQEYEDSIELVFVDSGSTDDTVGLARAYGANVTSIPVSEFNHGLTRNRGIEIASGEIMVLMSQDAVPGDRFLIKNFAAAFEDSQVAGAYARQVPRPDADILTKRNLNHWLTGRKTEEIRQITDWKAYQNLSPMERHRFYNFDDVCSAIRKSVWQSIPFRAQDFGEDIDWSQRVLEAGWKIAYWPKSYVIHSHTRSISYEYRRNLQTFKKLYEQYRLSLVSSRRQLLTGTLHTVITDWKYALRHERQPRKLAALLIQIPFLAFAMRYGQYMGTRAAQLEMSRPQELRETSK